VTIVNNFNANEGILCLVYVSDNMPQISIGPLRLSQNSIIAATLIFF